MALPRAGTFGGVCGRFLSTATAASIAELFDAEEPDIDLGLNYNVAPTQDVYAVLERPDHVRVVRSLRWGLVPVWAKDPSIGSRLINARSETAAEKPAFRDSLKRRRCIVPMSGFYEWKPGESTHSPGRPAKQVKQPVLIERSDGELLAVAGLWSAWADPAAEPRVWQHTCTVLTTAANETMAPIHDRMPVILEREQWEAWLDPEEHDVAALETLLVPAASGILRMREVSTEVNNVRNRGPFL